MTKESIMNKDLKLDRRELAIELSRHKPDRYPRVNMLMPEERIYGTHVDLQIFLERLLGHIFFAFLEPPLKKKASKQCIF